MAHDLRKTVQILPHEFFFLIRRRSIKYGTVCHISGNEDIFTQFKYQYERPHEFIHNTCESYTTFSICLSIPVYCIQEAQPHFIFMRNLPTFGIYRGNFAKRKKFFLPFLFDLL